MFFLPYVFRMSRSRFVPVIMLDHVHAGQHCLIGRAPHPQALDAPTIWQPLICGDDGMTVCPCFNPAVHHSRCYDDRRDRPITFWHFVLMIKNIYHSIISPTTAIFLRPNVTQVDSFSNSGRRGFCSWQLKAASSCAMMRRLPPTSWCCCRVVVRQSWKARRS